MHALKSPSFFRPSSRPSSPAPGSAPPSRSDSGLSLRESRPRTKLSLSTFRRPSPAPLPPIVPTTLIQDGSYLDALSLKLSEGVSKALAQPSGPANPAEVLNGRRPIPAGRGKALGSMIASEFNASKDNVHLRRAVLRALQRPLSVLLTNISTDLLPLLSSTAFLAAPTIQAPNSTAPQAHALALANFAGELLETFDELGLGLESDGRGESLKPIRDGLSSVVHRVVNPLVTGIKDGLAPLIEALERPNTSINSGSKGTAKTTQHPSIAAMQAIMPIYVKALTRYTATLASQSALATIIISLVWRGLVAISHRLDISSSSYPSSPPSPVVGGAKKPRRGSSTTPPVTPPSSRFTMKLPPSRPPSPPAAPIVASPAADARSLYELLNMLPRPVADRKITQIAREAVDEAFDGLKALVSLLDAVQNNGAHLKISSVEELEKDLDVLTAGLPIMIVLPVLLRAYVYSTKTETQTRTVASMVGLSEEEYRKGCLAGYGRAEECEVMVGERVFNALRKDASLRAQPGLGYEAVLLWLEGRINGEED